MAESSCIANYHTMTVLMRYVVAKSNQVVTYFVCLDPSVFIYNLSLVGTIFLNYCKVNGRIITKFAKIWLELQLSLTINFASAARQLRLRVFNGPVQFVNLTLKALRLWNRTFLLLLIHIHLSRAVDTYTYTYTYSYTYTYT